MYPQSMFWANVHFLHLLNYLYILHGHVFVMLWTAQTAGMVSSHVKLFLSAVKTVSSLKLL